MNSVVSNNETSNEMLSNDLAKDIKLYSRHCVIIVVLPKKKLYKNFLAKKYCSKKKDLIDKGKKERLGSPYYNYLYEYTIEWIDGK